MLSHISNTDLTLVFEFKIQGEFVMPDAGSISLLIRGADGTPMVGYPKALPDVTINTLRVLVPAAENILPGGRDLEARFAELSFLSQGDQGVVKTTYRIIAFAPYQVSPEDVRQALGISYGELSDDAVDLFQSYLKLKIDPSFDTAITAGNVSSIFANQVLLYTEALRLAPSLQARILKQEEKDNALYTRFLMDFDQLKADLLQALTDAKNNLEGEFGVEGQTTPQLLVVSNPTDPVTGV